MSNKRALETVREDEKPRITAKKARTEAGESTITKEEVQLYDRQIRLWGLEAQQRMRTAKILIAGVNGLTNEICKNIVLAGVGAVTVIDPGMVKEEDLGAQFFLREEDVKKSRAEAAARRMHDLNPRVDIKSIVGDIAEQSNEFVEGFDVVCLSGYDRKTMVRINNLCRAKNIKFWATGCAGFHGYIFSDLIEHTTETKKRAGEDDQKTVTTHEVTFVSLEEALNTTWDQLSSRPAKRRKEFVHHEYFAFGLLWKFQEEKGRLPEPNNQKDADVLLHMKGEYMAEVKADPSLLPDNVVRTFAQTARAEISPVCAVLGGLLGQEILKVLAANGAPINNFFAYDAFEPMGRIVLVPPAEFAKGKGAVQDSVPMEVEEVILDD
ncbi:hypothetical protein HDV00_003552 [Rhizophlyctis rosea]|nr:hypothetical protein HDV00_003552 [Rhizophlyctis rosea]